MISSPIRQAETWCYLGVLDSWLVNLTCSKGIHSPLKCPLQSPVLCWLAFRFHFWLGMGIKGVLDSKKWGRGVVPDSNEEDRCPRVTSQQGHRGPSRCQSEEMAWVKGTPSEGFSIFSHHPLPPGCSGTTASAASTMTASRDCAMCGSCHCMTITSPPSPLEPSTPFRPCPHCKSQPWRTGRLVVPAGGAYLPS